MSWRWRWPLLPLLAVVAGYLCVQGAVVGWHAPLGWDEAIYLSQVSKHGPVAWFDAPRARGITLLAAPVATFTTSLAALRLWLTVVSAVLLYSAFRTWVPVVRVRTATAAAAGFAAIWVSEFYGAELMPNLYVALAGVTACGFAVRGLRGEGRRALIMAALNSGWLALLRPSDAGWIVVGLLLAVAVAASTRAVARRDSVTVGVAVIVGFAVGAAEWVVEAYLRFGGVSERLHEAAAQNAGRLTFSLPDFARAANGPLLCRPCHVAGHSMMGAAWWAAGVLLVTVGVIAARRAGHALDALVPIAAGSASAAGYLFFIPYAAPRFLLPAYALLSIPAAMGVRRLAQQMRASGRRRWVSSASYALAALATVVFVASQLVVTRHEVDGRNLAQKELAATLAALHRLGLTRQCVIAGPVEFPLVYAAGCRNDYDALAEMEGAVRPTARDPLGDAAIDGVVFAALRGRLDGVTVAVIVPHGRLTPAVLSSDRWRPTPAPLGMIWRPPNAA